MEAAASNRRAGLVENRAYADRLRTVAAELGRSYAPPRAVWFPAKSRQVQRRGSNAAKRNARCYGLAGVSTTGVQDPAAQGATGNCTPSNQKDGLQMPDPTLTVNRPDNDSQNGGANVLLADIETASLDQIGERLDREWSSARRFGRMAIESAYRAGKCLVAAKSKVRHGEWLPWLADRDMPERAARRLMRLAELDIGQIVRFDTVSAALESLSAPPPADSARKRARKRARKGAEKVAVGEERLRCAHRDFIEAASLLRDARGEAGPARWSELLEQNGIDRAKAEACLALPQSFEAFLDQRLARWTGEARQ